MEPARPAINSPENALECNPGVWAAKTNQGTRTWNDMVAATADQSRMP